MKLRMQNASVSGHGFSALELLIVVVILAFAVLMVAPVRLGPDQTIQTQCRYNLKQVSIGCLMWLGDNGGAFPWQASTTNGGTSEFVPQAQALPQFQALSNYVKQPQVFVCPGDREREPADDYSKMSTDNLSYFISLDASTNHASSSILSGDRLLRLNGELLPPGLVRVPTSQSVSWAPGIHARKSLIGNLAFVDGHVESSRENLQGILRTQGVTTNRLVIP